MEEIQRKGRFQPARSTSIIWNFRLFVVSVQLVIHLKKGVIGIRAVWRS